jgi:hypothetical protein
VWFGWAALYRRVCAVYEAELRKVQGAPPPPCAASWSSVIDGLELTKAGTINNPGAMNHPGMINHPSPGCY